MPSPSPAARAADAVSAQNPADPLLFAGRAPRPPFRASSSMSPSPSSKGRGSAGDWAGAGPAVPHTRGRQIGASPAKPPHGSAVPPSPSLNTSNASVRELLMSILVTSDDDGIFQGAARPASPGERRSGGQSLAAAVGFHDTYRFGSAAEPLSPTTPPLCFHAAPVPHLSPIEKAASAPPSPTGQPVQAATTSAAFFATYAPSRPAPPLSPPRSLSAGASGSQHVSIAPFSQPLHQPDPSGSTSLARSSTGAGAGAAPSSLLETLTAKARARGRAGGLAGVDGFAWLIVAEGLSGHGTTPGGTNEWDANRAFAAAPAPASPTFPAPGGASFVLSPPPAARSSGKAAVHDDGGDSVVPGVGVLSPLPELRSPPKHRLQRAFATAPDPPAAAAALPQPKSSWSRGALGDAGLPVAVLTPAGEVTLVEGVEAGWISPARSFDSDVLRDGSPMLGSGSPSWPPPPLPPQSPPTLNASAVGGGLRSPPAILGFRSTELDGGLPFSFPSPPPVPPTRGGLGNAMLLPADSPLSEGAAGRSPAIERTERPRDADDSAVFHGATSDWWPSVTHGALRRSVRPPQTAGSHEDDGHEDDGHDDDTRRTPASYDAGPHDEIDVSFSKTARVLVLEPELAEPAASVPVNDVSLPVGAMNDDVAVLPLPLRASTPLVAARSPTGATASLRSPPTVKPSDELQHAQVGGSLVEAASSTVSAPLQAHATVMSAEDHTQSAVDKTGVLPGSRILLPRRRPPPPPSQPYAHLPKPAMDETLFSLDEHKKRETAESDGQAPASGDGSLLHAPSGAAAVPSAGRMTELQRDLPMLDAAVDVAQLSGSSNLIASLTVSDKNVSTGAACEEAYDDDDDADSRPSGLEEHHGAPATDVIPAVEELATSSLDLELPHSGAETGTAAVAIDISTTEPVCVIRSYAGICEAGWDPREGGSAPPTPYPLDDAHAGLVRKTNQDAIVLAEDAPSDGLMMAVFDGHGEYGHLVARWFAQRLPGAVWAHPAYGVLTDALRDNIPPPRELQGAPTQQLQQEGPPHPWSHPFSSEEVPGPGSPAVHAVPSSPRGGGKLGSAGQSPRVTVAPPVASSRPPQPRRDVAAAVCGALAELEAALLAAAVDGSLRAEVAAGEADDREHDDDGSAADVSVGPVDLSMSGCTACVLVAVGPHVTVCNVGDSRAVLVRASRTPAATASDSESNGGLELTAWPVSVDHKPSLPGETRRILLAGGRLAAIRYPDGTDGPTRVWLRDVDAPGLAMSRSLGDTLARSVGVTGAPDVYSYTLTPADAFLVLASDGLWEFVAPPTVARVLQETHAQAATAAEAATVGDDGEDEPPSHLALALDALAELSGQRWREREGAQDDLSILIAEVGTLVGDELEPSPEGERGA